MSGTAQSGGRELTIHGLTKRYGSVAALDDVSLTVPPGTFQALLGPSGSGKTSLLMSVAGFLHPDSGRIEISGRDITPLSPERRNFGMVFQGYALFPHLTVIENVMFPLRARGVQLAERRRRARAVIDLVQLGPYAERLPRELSGGQQQRVAIARAIVFEPELLLLDEPLSALDRALRSDLQAELKGLQRKLGITCLYVTHDQDEALSLADSVAVLAGGRIMQIGTATELYERPVSRFVASFLGKSNFFEGRWEPGARQPALFRIGGHVLRHGGQAGSGPALLALRPERIEIVRSGHVADPSWNTVRAVVTATIYLGNAWELHAEISGIGPVLVRAPSVAGAGIEPGQAVELAWPPDATRSVRPDSSPSPSLEGAVA